MKKKAEFFLSKVEQSEALEVRVEASRDVVHTRGWLRTVFRPAFKPSYEVQRGLSVLPLSVVVMISLGLLRISQLNASVFCECEVQEKMSISSYEVLVQAKPLFSQRSETAMRWMARILVRLVLHASVLLHLRGLRGLHTSSEKQLLVLDRNTRGPHWSGMTRYTASGKIIENQVGHTSRTCLFACYFLEICSVRIECVVVTPSPTPSQRLSAEYSFYGSPTRAL